MKWIKKSQKPFRFRLALRIPPRMVRRKGLEPICRKALEPKSSASTNSATFARVQFYAISPYTVSPNVK